MKKHHTKQKGDLGEAKAQADLIEKGYIVLTPASEYTPFDLAAYSREARDFYRIQVKYREKKDAGYLKLYFRRVWSNSKGIQQEKISKAEIDLFAVYCPSTDKVYYLNPDNFGKSVNLRVDKPKNNQSKGVHLAEDFTNMPSLPSSD